jgi:hypothetical protein
MSAKVPWNLSVNGELKRQMQIYCAAKGEEISELTERLYESFLKANHIGIVSESPNTLALVTTGKITKQVRYSKRSKRSKKGAKK